MPRLPGWLIYLTIVVAMLVVSLGRREHANAPRPPPPVPGADQAPISPSSPFANAPLVRLPVKAGAIGGTAFSISDRGVWLTARRAVDGCARPAVAVGRGWGVLAQTRAVEGDVAVLTTDGGAPALPLAKTQRPRAGDSGFLPGFSGGGPGEALHRPVQDEHGRDALDVDRAHGCGGARGRRFRGGNAEHVRHRQADQHNQRRCNRVSHSCK